MTDPRRPASPAEDTSSLRARFPLWGVLYDHIEGVWVAVKGKRTLVAASTPDDLSRRVEAIGEGEPGPAEGERTQTWRALRGHEK